LKIFTDWDLGKWYIKTSERTKVQISINFDTNYGIRRIVASSYISEDGSEMEEVTLVVKLQAILKIIQIMKSLSSKEKLQIMLT